MTTPPVERRNAELYEGLLRERLRQARCATCGASLAEAVVEEVDGGATHEDLRLTDASIAQALAATVYLLVRCAPCGSRVEIGSRLPAPVPQAAPPVARETPGASAAPGAYAKSLAARLRSLSCGRCGRSLGDAEVLATGGGTALEDHSLRDESMAQVLAATQDVEVRCRSCGQRGIIRAV